jgi:hypothetical protein
MGQDHELACRCGQIHGALRGTARETVNRAVCYCNDCQAFLQHLGRADLLGPHAGTDIVQVAPDTVTFDRGREHIEAVRLSPRGLYRFYARCCKTPLGNMVGPVLPFVGFAHEVFRDLKDANARDAAFGAVRGEVFGEFACGMPDGARKPSKPSLGMMAHVAGLLVRWKLGGHTWPSPFFEKGRKDPVPPVHVLTRAERDALRPLCGPNRSAGTPQDAREAP